MRSLLFGFPFELPESALANVAVQAVDDTYDKGFPAEYVLNSPKPHILCGKVKTPHTMNQSKSAWLQYGVQTKGLPVKSAPQGRPILDKTDRTYRFGVGASMLGLRILDMLLTTKCALTVSTSMPLPLTSAPSAALKDARKLLDAA